MIGKFGGVGFRVKVWGLRVEGRLEGQGEVVNVRLTPVNSVITFVFAHYQPTS